MKHYPLAPLTPCDACTVGACADCDGDTWDVDADRPGACPCREAGHDE